MLEEQYGQMERLRHDMKNHMIALQGLLDNREWEKMQNYLNQMLQAGNISDSEEVTGNKVADALLYRKRKQAEKKNIIWECDLHIPQICGVDEFDLCVLLGNMLDNAIEACDRMKEGAHKFINIQSGRIKGCLLIEVKNSTSMESIDETGISQKENPEEHGIGLINIRETAHKYDGVVNTEMDNGVFIISILIPLGDTGYDTKETV